MPAWYPLIGVLLFSGAALLLSCLPWFRARPLTERLAPYAPGGRRNVRRRSALSADSVVDVIAPLATDLGNRIAAMVGINDDLAERLRRSGSTLDTTAFRLRQVAWGLGSLMATVLIGAVIGVAPIVLVLLAPTAPLLSFLVLEQRVTSAALRWQHELTLELPVVAEQLGMLLSSGYSLGSAISRMGRRGKGHAAVELSTVSLRIRQGVSELDALREWAQRCGVTAIDRLVSVLALNWEASDLGTLISNEARAVRRDVQRSQIELIDRRAQQVWIPVTVATLLPGVIFMTVPFLAAMSALTGG